MAKITESLNLGDTANLKIEDLLNIISQMYTDLAIAVNKKPDLYERTTNGLTSDTFLTNGSININTNTQVVEMLVDRTATTVTWKTL